MIKHIICIACPRGCTLNVTGSGKSLIIEGNQCKKGLEYGRQEILQPLRMLTTTVRTTHSEYPRLPVRLSREIPKKDLREYMKIINGFTAASDCRPGDVLLESIMGADVNLIATGELSYEA